MSKKRRSRNLGGLAALGGAAMLAMKLAKGNREDAAPIEDRGVDKRPKEEPRYPISDDNLGYTKNASKPAASKPAASKPAASKSAARTSAAPAASAAQTPAAPAASRPAAQSADETKAAEYAKRFRDDRAQYMGEQAERARINQLLKDQALKPVRPEEYLIGPGALKGAHALAKHLALKKYVPPAPPLRIGTEPLKIGREPAKLGMKKGGTVKKKSGGMISKASKRADGCVIKGKTRGRMV